MATCNDISIENVLKHHKLLPKLDYLIDRFSELNIRLSSQLNELVFDKDRLGYIQKDLKPLDLKRFNQINAGIITGETF